MIIPERKTIFIHIPKTAGTAIEKYFNMGIVYNAWHHGTNKTQCLKHEIISDMKIKFPEEYGSYAKFTVVRNPYDRMVSWYFHLKERVESDGFDLEKDFTLSFIKWIEDPFKTNYTKWSLSEVGQKDPNPIYLNPQHTYIDETVTVLKYENLRNELNEYFGKEISLPIYNKSSLRKGHFLNYYNKYSLDIVYDRYKEDFEKFNYERIEKI